ncbi:hypothetical protein [Engelhardtia mirabilis]|uniref:Uncharacterized protein n=1 Tax=Engelhardtia mirabilis TaxID=2528011 RepID=A0A518BGV6_9BACT|nr:hypothetical protein Pla133_12620 [Planctomycetes bacterium Pla133]QDV00523.1 hypothetical protein Pla86_12620 [Planctomycetes bacterium Pla86]
MVRTADLLNVGLPDVPDYGSPWVGIGVVFDLSIPNSTSLIGLTVFLQGAFVGLGSASMPSPCTGGKALRFEGR